MTRIQIEKKLPDTLTMESRQEKNLEVKFRET